MSQRLERLIYRSQMAAGLDGQVEMPRILATSMRRNHASGIVGALSFSGNTFVQVLEGRQDRIGELMARLSADPRHYDIRILARWPIVAPMFDEWSMAQTDLGQLAAIAVNKLVSDGSGAELTAMMFDLAAKGPSSRARVVWI
jgi:hypothetical protein